ncbi:MAG: rhodanese-like domain-containing protein, partial [Myxococcota bacterium]
MKTIDAEGVQDLLDGGDGRVLNVLPAASFEKVHIPRSESVPLDALKERAHEILADDEEIVVHCTDRNCDLSTQAAKFLTDEGFDR